MTPHAVTSARSPGAQVSPPELPRSLEEVNTPGSASAACHDRHAEAPVTHFAQQHRHRLSGTRSLGVGATDLPITLATKRAVLVHARAPSRLQTLAGVARQLPVYFRQALGFLPLLFILTALLCAVLPEQFASHDPRNMSEDAILAAPGAVHLFGTDQYGRDVFSLVVHGARQSLILGVCAVFLGGSIGVFLGMLAGFSGGRADRLIMRLIDVWLSVPDILLAIIIATALGSSFSNVILAISLMIVPAYARVMRSSVLAVRHRAFVEASRSMGASTTWIVVRHVLPHCLSPLLVKSTIGIGTAILAGAGLSFLGLGAIEELPDWGYTLAQGRSYLSVAPWICIFPGLAITLLVIAINLVGESLKHHIDLKQRSH